MRNTLAILFLSIASAFGAATVMVDSTTHVITFPLDFAAANGLGSGSGGSGESNTVSSLGTGWKMFANKSGVDLRFNTLSNAFEFLSSSNNNVITFGLSAAALSGFSGTSNQVNTVQTGLSTTSNRVETVNTAKQDHTSNLDSWSALAPSAKQDALGFTPARATRLISTTAPLAGGGDLSADRTLTIPASSDGVDGYLTGSDHTAFNAKVATTRSISTTAPLSGGGDLSANRTFSIPASSDGVDGYLTGSDHTYFAAKQAAFTPGLGITNRSGILSNNIVAGTHISITAGANGQETIATTGLVIGTDIEAWSSNLDAWSGLATSAKQDALGFTAVPNTRSISTTAPITGGGDLSANRTFAMAASSDSVDGYLSAADHTTFNAKQSALGFTPPPNTRTISTTAPITGGGDLSANRTFAIAASSDSVDGYLTSGDHTTFNTKVGTSRTITAGVGLSGGGDLSANRTLTLDLSTFVGNISMWDASQSSRTWTANLSGSTDPAWTYSDGIADLSTGTLKQGGNAVARSTDVQVFTVGSGTWTKLAGSKSVRVVLIGGGGGGGAGRRGPSLTAQGGGASGSGAGYSETVFDPAALTSTVTVTVGGGGPGGAAQTSDTSNGAAGAPGTNTSFGTYIYAGAGSQGNGGTSAAGGATANGNRTIGTVPGNIGITGSDGSAAGVSGNGGSATAGMACASGGAGGGVASDGSTVRAGGVGGGLPSAISGATGTTSGGGTSGIGSAGGDGSSAGTNVYLPGAGGGGGGGRVSGGAGYAGGAGGGYGGGGGGGGASINGINSGAGGPGANGILVVTTYF